MLVRRIAAAGALVALVLLQFDYELVSFPFSDRKRLHQMFTLGPDRGWSDYPQFLEGVRARTNPGDRIAIVFPVMKWEERGYEYAYYRASYFLSGREVLPLLYRTDDLLVENFQSAKYLAVWRTAAPPGTVVWEEAGGVLVRSR